MTQLKKVLPATSDIAYLGTPIQLSITIDQSCDVLLELGSKTTVIESLSAGQHDVHYEVTQLGKHLFTVGNEYIAVVVVNPFNLKTKMIRTREYDILEVQLTNMTDQVVYLEGFLLEGSINNVNKDKPGETESSTSNTILIPSMGIYIHSFLTPLNDDASFGKIEMMFNAADGQSGRLQSPPIKKKNMAEIKTPFQISHSPSRVLPAGDVEVHIVSDKDCIADIQPSPAFVTLEPQIQLLAQVPHRHRFKARFHPGVHEIGTLKVQSNHISLGHVLISE